MVVEKTVLISYYVKKKKEKREPKKKKNIRTKPSGNKKEKRKKKHYRSTFIMRVEAMKETIRCLKVSNKYYSLFRTCLLMHLDTLPTTQESSRKGSFQKDSRNEAFQELCTQDQQVTEETTEPTRTTLLHTLNPRKTMQIFSLHIEKTTRKETKTLP